MAWTCSECGADLEEANRRRARLRLPPLYTVRQVCCTPACTEVRSRRRYLQKQRRKKTQA